MSWTPQTSVYDTAQRNTLRCPVDRTPLNVLDPGNVHCPECRTFYRVDLRVAQKPDPRLSSQSERRVHPLVELIDHITWSEYSDRRWRKEED